MPGVFGGYKAGSAGGIQSLQRAMIQALDPEGRLDIGAFVDEVIGVGLGHAGLKIFKTGSQPARDAGGQVRLAFHGELYNDTVRTGDADFVLQEYLKHGDSCFRTLRGAFHIAIYDGRTRKIKLISDKLGLHPLYFTLLPEGILFSGETRALLADKSVSRKPDYACLADFYRFGHPLGCKTLFRDLHLLPPAGVLTYDLQTRSYTIDRYWRLLDLFQPADAKSARTSLDDAVSSLVDAVQVRSRDRDLLGLSLSGGLDSRAILAALGPTARGLPTYTLGQEGCMDQRVACRLARIAGTRHTFLPIGKEQLADYPALAGEMLRLSEGYYHPHECTEMVALSYFKRAPFRILLRGHGGEIAKAAEAFPVRFRAEATRLSGGGPALEHIYAKGNIVLLDADPARLFSAKIREVALEGPRRSLWEGYQAASETLNPADLFIYYYTNEYVRRLAVASLEIFRSEIEIRMPFLDEVFLDQVLRLPVRSRTNGDVQLALISRLMPDAVRIPNSNTGAPLNAGPLYLYFLDHLNVVLKRLRVPGFRHYMESDNWYRGVFRDAIGKIIFSERSRERDLYEMNYLQSLFREHLSGRKDYGNLLGSIAGLELWFRQAVDQADHEP
jgi:asparagine synthase (glutamine-hydrolysing)